MAAWLVRLGSVLGITISDVNWNPGVGLGVKSLQGRPNQQPYTHWTNVEAGSQATPDGLLLSGNCKWDYSLTAVPWAVR